MSVVISLRLRITLQALIPRKAYYFDLCELSTALILKPVERLRRHKEGKRTEKGLGRITSTFNAHVPIHDSQFSSSDTPEQNLGHGFELIITVNILL